MTAPPPRTPYPFPPFSTPAAAAAALLALALLAGCRPEAGGRGAGGAAPEKKVQLKLATFYDTSVPILGDAVLNLEAKVEAASGGSIQIKVFNPGELVGPMEILDAVAAGKIEAGYAAAGFWMGKIPAAPLFSAVPFGPDATEFMAWLYAGNGMSLYQEMYDQAGMEVKVLVCALIPPETSGWFTQEITSPDDLRGLKMRFFGLGGAVMQKLGVAVTVLPGGEIFPALEKGVIDATEFSMPSIDENMQLHKLAKNNYFPGWHQQTTAFELLVNKAVWEQLSPAQQAVLEVSCRDTVVHCLALGDATQAAAMERNALERGVANRTWSPEMLALFKRTWLEVVAEQSAADPFFKRVWDDLSAFRETYRTWGDKGYLPRGAGR